MKAHFRPSGVLTGVEVSFAPEDYKGVNVVGDANARFLAMYDDDLGNVELWMQHMALHKERVGLPGRVIDMSLEDFSRLVDELVALRDKIAPPPVERRLPSFEDGV